MTTRCTVAAHRPDPAASPAVGLDPGAPAVPGTGVDVHRGL